LRSEILDWMARELAVVEKRVSSSRTCARMHPRQACLPLECAPACPRARGSSISAREKASNHPQGRRDCAAS
jgi:hypothetical protein